MYLIKLFILFYFLRPDLFKSKHFGSVFPSENISCAKLENMSGTLHYFTNLDNCNIKLLWLRQELQRI